MSTIIRCENLTKRYGSTRAINELTIELDDGDPIVLIGPNGAGKTTLISLICGFIQPSRSPGIVLLDEPTAGIDPPNARMIRELIREQSSSMTFIVSSHNLDELERLCSTVVYLEQGSLVSLAAVNGDEAHDVLTLRAPNIPTDEFITLCGQLPVVNTVTVTTQGDYLIETDNEMLASVAVMQLLADKGWRYRQIARGKTLEERLYGNG